MRAASDIVSEIRLHREDFESRFTLPWLVDTGSESVWSHPSVRAVFALADQDAAPVVAVLLEEPSFVLKAIGLHALAVHRCRSLLPRASTRLHDQSAFVRTLASEALGLLGDASEVDALLDTKDSESPDVKVAIVCALERLHDVRCVPFLSRWAGRSGEHEGVRRAACGALGSIGDDAGVPVLQRIASDDTASPVLRASATHALGHVGGGEARQQLTEGRADKNALVRAAAAEASGYLCDPSLAGAIAAMATDAMPLVRMGVAAALGHVGGPDAVACLRALLTDRDRAVRVRALGELVRITHAPGILPAGRSAADLDDRMLNAAIAAMLGSSAAPA